MDKLLPCPFCGGEAEFERMGDRRQSCIVACTYCGCQHESSDEDENNGRSWNARHAPEGWQLVPVEPRKEQLDAFNAADKWLHSNDGAGYLAASSFDGAKGEPYYKAMLAAAPKWGGG